ncbi:MAG: HRDC domain-containing protein [Verrucomicrobiota bacterium]
MHVRLFQYPFPAPDELPELNRFLAEEKVVSLKHHIVSSATGGAMLVFVVETVGSTLAKHGASAGRGSTEARIDYKKVLSEEDFSVFSELREARKKAAQKEDVPIYAVFTNEQLATMVRERIREVAQIRKIPGVAEGRVTKYGEAMVQVLREAFAQEGKEEEIG